MCFGAKVYTIRVHGPFGAGMFEKGLRRVWVSGTGQPPERANHTEFNLSMSEAL